MYVCTYLCILLSDENMVFIVKNDITSLHILYRNFNFVKFFFTILVLEFCLKGSEKVQKYFDLARELKVLGT